MLRIGLILAITALAAACGGGGGSGSSPQSDAGNNNADGNNTGGSNTAVVSNDDVRDPTNGDVFTRLEKPMTWLQSERFTHSYVKAALGVLGTDIGPGYTCEPSLAITTDDLRDAGTRITANRVCVDTFSANNCVYDGANGVRIQRDDSDTDSMSEIVLISIEGSDNRFFTLTQSYTTSFSGPDIELSTYGVGLIDNSCSANVMLDFRPDNIHGEWVTRVYRIGDDGGNEIVSSHLLNCANYTCFTDSGDFLIEDITSNGSSDDSGALYYEGQSSINGASGVIRGAIDRDKNHFGMVACPVGATKAAVLDQCLLITGKRQ